ncbi:unnamed protein product, partial [Mesorhabditis spiculigera]
MRGGLRAAMTRWWRGPFVLCLVVYAFIAYAPYATRQATQGQHLPDAEPDHVDIDHQLFRDIPNDVPNVPVIDPSEKRDVQKEWNQALKEAKDRIEVRRNEQRPKPIRIDRKDPAEVVPPVMPKPKSENLVAVESSAGKASGSGSSFKFEFRPAGGQPFVVENVMTAPGISFEERMVAKVDPKAPPKLIVTWHSGLNQENMGGCPEWNCKVANDRGRAAEADAVILMHDEQGLKRNPDQYYIYFSQESPAHAGAGLKQSDFFNMSFGYRHDTAGASPYGYTVKLAPESYQEAPFINETRVKGKTKTAAWFVSHCGTASQRERLVEKMKETLEVDIYGACGTKSCPRGGACEDMLDNDYYFYITFENSICKDYITEKAWNQGYGRDLIPVVLKRSLAEPYLPPGSFIAADDFETVSGLTAHMRYLMANTTAYTEYFNWRRDYKVVFLNGRTHDVLERPWGMCQICRLLWLQPRPKHSIPDFSQWWDKSCEPQGDLVGKLLRASAQKTP